MSARGLGRSALGSLAAAGLALGGCLSDLSVGLSAAEPQDAGRQEDPPAVDAGKDPGEDAGNSRDSGSRIDAGAPEDAGSDAAVDANARRDAGPTDAEVPARDACAHVGAGCPPVDAGELPPCAELDCVIVMVQPFSFCENGSASCRRDDAGECSWMCVPPFFAPSSDADSDGGDAGR